jgi:hypothetical protein
MVGIVVVREIYAGQFREVVLLLMSGCRILSTSARLFSAVHYFSTLAIPQYLMQVQ